MAVGLTTSKTEIDTVSGSIARDVNTIMQRVTNHKLWLDGIQDSDLTALGYSPNDIANLRTAFTDANQLASIFIGNVNLSVAKDFRTFLKRIWGFGT